jgi:uncharacterized protein (DUF2237 family)
MNARRFGRLARFEVGTIRAGSEEPVAECLQVRENIRRPGQCVSGAHRIGAHGVCAHRTSDAHLWPPLMQWHTLRTLSEPGMTPRRQLWALAPGGVKGGPGQACAVTRG